MCISCFLFAWPCQAYSHPEALMLYVEMLAHAHLDPSFVTNCANVSLRRTSDRDRGNFKSSAGASSSSGSSQQGGSSISTERIKQFLSAARQIENLICTSRESLLGSSAWKADFLAALKSRPFYYVTDVSLRERKRQTVRQRQRKGDCGRGTEREI